jgi:flagellar protein FlbT
MMALKLTLKPHERFLIGGAVTAITNGSSSGELIIENRVPILIREKDIMRTQDATSPCRKLYFIVQLMYLDEQNLVEYHRTYWNMVKDILEAAPSTLQILDQISEHILNSRYYYALKAARELIKHEEKIMQGIKQSEAGVPC